MARRFEQSHFFCNVHEDNEKAVSGGFDLFIPTLPFICCWGHRSCSLHLSMLRMIWFEYIQKYTYYTLSNILQLLLL